MAKKIYTRTGDEGVTSFGDHKKIAKASELFELIRVLDELNCFLGFAAESVGAGGIGSVFAEVAATTRRVI